MWTYLSTFLLSVIVALVTTPMIRHLATRWGVVDKPGGRRIHDRPIPRMGGIAIAAALLVSTIGVFAFSYLRETVFQGETSVFVETFRHAYPASLMLCIGAMLILALGIYDDVKGTRPFIKLGVQIGVALLCYHMGFQVQIIGLPWSREPFELGVLSLPFTILWMVVIINAINLIDGIDGLASGASFFACVTMFILAYSGGDKMNAFVLAALGGAILGFLVFNSNPAQVFLGDSGSLLLGFVLAAVSVRGSTKGATAFSVLVSAMALGLPLLDTSLAVVRRMLTGKPLMRADREHIHHRLLQRGLSQRQVVLALYGLSAFLASLALATSFLHRHRALLIVMFIALAGLLLVTMRYLGYVQHIKEQRRNIFLHEMFAGMSIRTDVLLTFRDALSAATDLNAVWKGLLELAEPFQLDGLRLEMFDPADREHPKVLEHQQPPRPARRRDDNVASIVVTLGDSSTPSGRLTVWWKQSAGETHPELYRLYFELIKTELECTIGEILPGEHSLAPKRLSGRALPKPDLT